MISLIIALIIIGALLYIIQILPIDGTIKQICYVIIVIATILWLLQAFGVIGGVPVPRIQ